MVLVIVKLIQLQLHSTTTTSSDVPVNQRRREKFAIVKGDEYKIQPEFGV